MITAEQLKDVLERADALVFGVEHGGDEVSVGVSAPAPVDVEHAVGVVSVDHEGVSA